jgi:NAD(P)-dependent dehydrogenase (short-subunit alcohol dehydrogenase family)
MLTGKSALVTGSTQGIGLAIATRLAALGCNVMLNGLGKLDEIEAKRRRLAEAHGVRVLFDAPISPTRGRSRAWSRRRSPSSVASTSW